MSSSLAAAFFTTLSASLAVILSVLGASQHKAGKALIYMIGTLCVLSLFLGRVYSHREGVELGHLEQARADVLTELISQSAKSQIDKISDAQKFLEQFALASLDLETPTGYRSYPWLRLGRMWYTLGNLPNAEYQYKRAIREDPRCAICFYELGVTYFLAGKKNQADGPLTKALLMAPNASFSREARCLKKDIEGEPQPECAEKANILWRSPVTW